MYMFKKKNKNKEKSWADIKLYQLQEINELPEFDEEIDYVIEKLAILLNTDPSNIEQMPINELMEEFGKWNFLNKEPKEKSTPTITINGNKYGMIELSKISMAQLVDIEEYINDGLMKNIHKLFSVIYLPIKNKKFFSKSGYELEKYEPSIERQEDFKVGTLDILYPQMLFFYHIVKVYLTGSLTYSAQNLMKMMEKFEMEMKTKLLTESEEVLLTQKLKILKELKENGTGIH
jgi:hypothetical protein